MKFLNRTLLKSKCTLLGVGPMSQNCVDAAINIANDYSVPIMLIASRRQIDSKEFGGGYVNNWTTEDFSNYILKHDKNKNIILARDHGGPWQNNIEKIKKLNLKEAMQSAKNSFKADIDAGFEIIHIDTSFDLSGQTNQLELLERLYELYDYCWSYATSQKKEIIFEVGTEEQSGSTNTQEELDYNLSAIKNFCEKNKLPHPKFVVVQTGTRVMELRNVGSFDSPLRVEGEIPAEIQVPKMIEVCKKHNIFMKQHNTDYLSDTALSWHPRLGIHAANVAPEFGVIETKSILNVMEKYGQYSLAERFLELSYNSRKWDKWMLKNSIATEREKSIISGHYIFSTSEFLEIKNNLKSFLLKKNIDLDSYIQKAIKESIFRYLINFRLV